MSSVSINRHFTQFEWAGSGITDVLGELGRPSKIDVRNEIYDRLRSATPVRARAPVIVIDTDEGTTSRQTRDILFAALSLVSVTLVVMVSWHDLASS
ncbi:hypothetical protein IFR05_010470 [Cadophora sp. M221]|nr:hypothetical protein IFR05_010470 [Cadophora sp. M221]